MITTMTTRTTIRKAHCRRIACDPPGSRSATSWQPEIVIDRPSAARSPRRPGLVRTLKFAKRIQVHTYLKCNPRVSRPRMVTKLVEWFSFPRRFSQCVFAMSPIGEIDATLYQTHAFRGGCVS